MTTGKNQYQYGFWIFQTLFDRRKQIHKPSFYYCKKRPHMEFLTLNSIEHHIKFKDRM